MKLQDRNIENEFEFRTSRSGGKGGQNVNKVETKVELYFNIAGSVILSEEEKKKLLSKLKNRIDKNGVLKISSQTERSQLLNKYAAVEKFFEITAKALEKEKIRRKVKLSKADKEKRLDEKKKISGKKALRKINLKNTEE
ncbi:MAG TPA: alternative ribosome rescue aminoacyl-tRNA hydrolase ArfB [Ignavibacteria bacterium]|nr:alternative ribosome rescue aminoacyl-tRNA hydrolase ArfB [Ignavibacteria bacterium]